MAATRHTVCKADDVPEGKGEAFIVEGRRIALFNVGGEFYALEDRCSHADAPIVDGFVNPGRRCVACPWHGAAFDLRNGAALSGPACGDIHAFPVSVEGGELLIEIGEA